MTKSIEQDIAMIHNNIQNLVRVGKIPAVTIELDKLTNIYDRNSDYLNEQIIALQNENAEKDKRIAELDRKLLQYQDDYFGGAE